ncbi:hypothetical protein JTE90_000294 [Oedothorax gibbosus]|uniref:Uncharacterized protein n=1 Tax=Oedothorax gibbosus TaxID=931172 RepID=A0AAV6VUI4_9ARAC|nr:hypothetical protein JTE90_000294 [Oedothorax gibbosus]
MLSKLGNTQGKESMARKTHFRAVALFHQHQTIRSLEQGREEKKNRGFRTSSKSVGWKKRGEGTELKGGLGPIASICNVCVKNNSRKKNAMQLKNST